MILIGSRAAKHWHPDFPVKEDADWDIIASPEEAKFFMGTDIDTEAHSWKHGNVEFHNANFLNNYFVEDMYAWDSIDSPVGLVEVCSSVGLAAIKRSHLWRRLGFVKHILHYQRLDRDFLQDDLDFIDERVRMTKEAFPQREIPHNVTNEVFFDDNVTKIYDHEELHKVVAHYEQPIYLSLKRDLTMAAIEEDLWDKLKHDDKLKCILEEVYVIAIERFVVMVDMPWKMACYKALEKVCTTLCIGFFRDYAIDNWQELTNLFNKQPFEKFEQWKLLQPSLTD